MGHFRRDDSFKEPLPSDWNRDGRLQQIIARLKAGVPILTLALEHGWDDHALAQAMRQYGRLAWLDNEEIAALIEYRQPAA